VIEWSEGEETRDAKAEAGAEAGVEHWASMVQAGEYESQEKAAGKEETKDEEEAKKGEEKEGSVVGKEEKGDRMEEGRDRMTASFGVAMTPSSEEHTASFEEMVVSKSDAGEEINYSPRERETASFSVLGTYSGTTTTSVSAVVLHMLQ
jgi:hypothetical protein